MHFEVQSLNPAASKLLKHLTLLILKWTQCNVTGLWVSLIVVSPTFTKGKSFSTTTRSSNRDSSLEEISRMEIIQRCNAKEFLGEASLAWKNPFHNFRASSSVRNVASYQRSYCQTQLHPERIERHQISWISTVGEGRGRSGRLSFKRMMSVEGCVNF